MPLKKYWEKRKFEGTLEPKGKVLETSKDRFVVQEHSAEKAGHHFDFRLEIKGVLKSWAVPKGVPEKTGIRRLALETENHPIQYLNFEGKIPEGNYGAGIVKIFDKGKYKLIEKAKDRIIFELKGKKLKGDYSLIKMKGRRNQWLLFKLK